MLLIFGGTTEGRKAAAVCDQAGQPYYYSTKGNEQQLDMVHGIRIHGAMNEDKMAAFCHTNAIRLVVDAAHPFAAELHRTIATVSAKYNIPVIRYERKYPEYGNDLLWFDSYQEAITWLEAHPVNRPLFLTGVNTIPAFKSYWLKHPAWFRILDREESRNLAQQAGFPVKQLLFYGNKITDAGLFDSLLPEVIILKESGDSGGFPEKVEAARKRNIPVVVIRRPALPNTFIPVNGGHTLRRAIEKNLPGFFGLRTGYTTGSCAAAAAKAALVSLLSGYTLPEVTISLPDGELLDIPVHAVSVVGDAAIATVLKDAGDDPDVTNGLPVQVTVQLAGQQQTIRFLRGEGVGLVTLPGIGIEPGEPAINPVPRRMICRELKQVLDEFKEVIPKGFTGGIDITVAVPGGEEIAKKTFNPKLGITGGISIIGTSGIVRPFSSEAFVEAIRREMAVAKAVGCRQLVVNSGAKSERLIKKRFPDLPPQAFIHYGNFIGETLRIAHGLEVEQLILGIMIGKAVKLAGGALDTHSKKVTMNTAFIQSLLRETHYPPEMIEKAGKFRMARQLLELLPSEEEPFYRLLVRECYRHCRPLFPVGKLEIILLLE